MKSTVVVCLLGASLALQGCSSRPREFVPTLAALPADQAKFDADHASCRQFLAQGKLDSDGKLASAVSGAGAAATIGAAGGMAASTAGLYAGAAIASATLVALPLVAIGSAWGTAKVKQKRKEAAIQRAMTGCLRGRGYEVTDWKRNKGKVPEQHPAAAAK